jgi:glycosyltransferase involved in cell wall biosynthesis
MGLTNEARLTNLQIQSAKGRSLSFVLVTAAHNEEALIGGVIESVLRQTMRPAKWVIVSDSSTDRTDEIVQSYSSKFDFIKFLRVSQTARGTPSKVNALRLGFPLLDGTPYDFIGNLDADVCLPSDYYEYLLEQFGRDRKLGICAGAIFEEKHGHYMSRSTNRRNSVAHAAQLVRRECFEAIDGYFPLKYGGEDWCAEVSSRMKGWNTESLKELRVLHLRPTGTSYRWHRRFFREGQADRSFGSGPVFETIKCMRRVNENPIVIGALVRLAGFWWSIITRESLGIPRDVARFLRQEQRARLHRLICSVLPQPSRKPQNHNDMR